MAEWIPNRKAYMNIKNIDTQCSNKFIKVYDAEYDDGHLDNKPKLLYNIIVPINI